MPIQELELPVRDTPFGPITALGFTSRGPVWPAMGGAEDEEAEDDDDSTTDDEDDDTTDVEIEDEADEDEDGENERQPAGRKNAGNTGRDEDKTPEELKAELDKTRTMLSKSRSQQTRWRNKALASRDSKNNDGRDATAGDKRVVKAVVKDGGTDADAREKGEERGLSREDVLEMIADARAEEAEKAAAKYKPAAIRAEAKDLLKEAGYKLGDDAESHGRRLDRALKLMDTSDVELDDDGTPLGVEEAVDKFREEFPELFASEEDEGASAQARRPRRRINGRAGGKPSVKEMKASEGQLAFLRGHIGS
jgi:hypothetical protein